LDSRQLKTVAGRKFGSLNTFRAIVQFTPPRQTRHRQDRLVVSGGRCELCIMCFENSVPLSRDWGGSRVRGLVIPQSALLDVTMCGLWMHAGPAHPDAYLDICPRHLPPVGNNYPGFLPYDKCPPPRTFALPTSSALCFHKMFFLKRKFNSQRQTLLARNMA